MQNHTSKRSALLEELLRIARQLGVEHLSFGVNNTCVQTMVDAGAMVSRTIIAPTGEQPYVVDTARLVCFGLAVSALRDRQPASPDQLRALESDQAVFHVSEYKAVELLTID